MLAMQQNMEIVMQHLQDIESRPHLPSEEPSRLPRPHPRYDGEYDDQDVIDHLAAHPSRHHRSYLICYMTSFISISVANFLFFLV